MGENNSWWTKDIAIAAYVSMRGEKEGITLLKVERNGRESKFYFKDPNSKIEGITMSFPQSESFKFDSAIRVLKSLGYSNNIK